MGTESAEPVASEAVVSVLHRLLIPLAVASSAVAAAIFLLPPAALPAVNTPAASPAVNTKLFAYVHEPVEGDLQNGIWLKDANGALVTHLDPGTYAIEVDDESDRSSFHLRGPGVDMKTRIDEIVHTTWTVTFNDGTYHYSCDFNPTFMHGSFTVGNPPPPPPPNLKGKVGPGKTISLKTAAGAAVKSLTAGTYSVSVQDLTKKDNFHLSGLGISKKTSVKGKSKPTWKLTFEVGTYILRSDAHKTLKRKFSVVAAP
jgi:hypothetical protein